MNCLGFFYSLDGFRHLLLALYGNSLSLFYFGLNILYNFWCMLSSGDFSDGDFSDGDFSGDNFSGDDFNVALNL